MTKKKGLAIGQDDFLKLRKMGSYYVDKSLLIKDVIDSNSTVLVFTRPRRFGKSLNISMLGYFFDLLEVNAASVFEDLTIMTAGEAYLKEQNQYPTIRMTLKDAEGSDFESAFVMLQDIVAEEYKRHSYLLQSPRLTASEKLYFERVMDEESSKSQLKQSLGRLAKYLYRHYEKEVVILIDEYDVPLEKSYFEGYYIEMVHFIRGFFWGALKSNRAVHKAVITGCLRVSKESIFTGVNNLDIVSILSHHFDEYFGFTESEVEQLLAYYGLEEKMIEAKQWYNGYRFGETVVFNPWSAIKYVHEVGAGGLPSPYWSNTSSNDIIKNLVKKADSNVKAEIEMLLQGKPLHKVVSEDIVYGEIENNMDNLWSFLYFTGYLKRESSKMIGEKLMIELSIPNREVKYIFDTKIKEWFLEEFLSHTNFEALYAAIRNGDALALERELTKHASESISFLDHYENFYHGFVVGISKGLPDYLVISNRESGQGRSDIFVMEKAPSNRALILELKMSNSFLTLEQVAAQALQQIEDKNYDQALLYEGYTEIEKYGIAFFKKRCKVLKQPSTAKSSPL